MAHIQRSWNEREAIEGIQTSIKVMAEFLNKFDGSTRYRLAVINERLAKLEREVSYLEAAIRSPSSGHDPNEHYE
jgi:uncharacterized protein